VIWLRSLAYTALLFLSVLVYSVLVIVSGLFGPARSFAVARSWADLNLWLLKTICGLSCTVEGVENIPGRNAIVFIKHQSVFETIWPFTRFPITSFVLKRELMWIPLLGWALHVIKPIAINRRAGGSAVRQVVRQGRERLAAGCWVIVYPEGTRMPPGTTRRYGVSGALLASETGYAVLPIAHNAGDFWPRRGLRKHPGNITIVIGPPIEPADKSPAEINQEAQSWIEGTMARISASYRNSRDSVAN
jgi:1-acyl-sn-glycerol-3-phosphate acyltransferase